MKLNDSFINYMYSKAQITIYRICKNSRIVIQERQRGKRETINKNLCFAPKIISVVKLLLIYEEKVALEEKWSNSSFFKKKCCDLKVISTVKIILEPSE